VGIAGDFYEQLIVLGGDEGARHVLAANEQALVKIPVGDPGVIRDIDRPEDLTPPIRV
jgi:molybdenum cofactor cytidylyltransferase